MAIRHPDEEQDPSDNHSGSRPVFILRALKDRDDDSSVSRHLILVTVGSSLNGPREVRAWASANTACRIAALALPFVLLSLFDSSA